MVSQKKTQVPPLLTPLHTKTFLHHHATTRNTVSFITRVFICEHCDHEHVFTFTPSHSFASHSFQGFSFVSIVTTNTFLHSRRRTHSRLIHLQGFHLWALWLRTRFYKHAVALLRSHIIQPLYHTPFTHHSHTIQPQWHHNDTIIIHGLRPRCKHIWSHTIHTQWHHNDTIFYPFIYARFIDYSQGEPLDFELIFHWFSLIFIASTPAPRSPKGEDPLCSHNHHTIQP